MIDGRPRDPRPRIALAHDWLCGYRGGEAVLERIVTVASQIGDVDHLYAMFDDGRPVAPAIDRIDREVSSLAEFPEAARRWLLPAYPAAVAELGAKLAARHAESPIDLLVSTSSAAIKGLEAPEGVPHLCYCHAPARYVWSIGAEYAAGRGPGARVRRLGLSAFGPAFRRWDRRTAANVTAFIANSTQTAEQIRRCFGRDAEIVHPPVRTLKFTTDEEVAREDFWLFVGALEPYKRVDLAIEAAGRAGILLKVAGHGSLLADVRRRVGSSLVEVLGRVSDDALLDLYRRARLLIFPQIEDFGITAVEAQACGCPVVARRAGGALDTVLEGQTGAFFNAPDPDAVVAAARECPEGGPPCRANAERFSEAKFDARMAAHMLDALADGGASAHGRRG
ncbi:MAG: glycosyltransferase [Phycisphaerales bacterium]|nr:glycosyltransferase [Phycisphaerales bacterium]